MALDLIDVKRYSRNSGNGQIAPHQRYLTREHDRHNRRLRDEEKPKDDLYASGHQGLPAWAEENPTRYWEACDRYTVRQKALLAREIHVALPVEFGHEQNLALGKQLLATIPQNVPVSWVMHIPMQRGQTRTNLEDTSHENPHMHILIGTKQDDGYVRTARQWFGRHDSTRPGETGAPMSTYLYTDGAVEGLRRQWRKMLTQELQRHGLTLQRPRQELQEPRLHWQKMDGLDKLLAKEDRLAGRKGAEEQWLGFEYRIPRSTITTWLEQGRITYDQHRWLIQRSRRQVAQQLTRTYDQQRSRPVWHFVAQQALRRDVAALSQQQQALTALATRYVNPALQRQQQRRYQQQMRQQTRRLAQTPGQERHPHGRGWEWELAVDEGQRPRQRQAR